MHVHGVKDAQKGLGIRHDCKAGAVGTSEMYRRLNDNDSDASLCTLLLAGVKLTLHSTYCQYRYC